MRQVQCEVSCYPCPVWVSSSFLTSNRCETGTVVHAAFVFSFLGFLVLYFIFPSLEFSAAGRRSVNLYFLFLGCMAELDLALQVTSPHGKQLHHLENVHSGQFAFTSKESGKYVACFWLQSAHPNVHLNLALDWKTGVGAKD